jgi:hypothetical protein
LTLALPAPTGALQTPLSSNNQTTRHLLLLLFFP